MDVSDVKASTLSGTVHGVVVGELSPVKTSSKNRAVKYFDGRFSDGKKTVRLVSFDPTLRNKFEEIRKSGEGLALQNCFVKRKADDFELHVNNKSSIISSPKKFKVSEESVENGVSCAELRTLEELKDLAEHQRVSFTGKVTSVSSVEELVKKSNGKSLRKQDFVIADTTESCRGVLWEEHLNQVEVDCSYRISNATVRSFNGAKYFSVGEQAVIKAVGDIGDIVDELVFDGNGGIVVVQGEIIVVIKIENYVGCKNCSSKVVQVGAVGECTKCGAKMKLGKCKSKYIARVIVEDVDGKEHRVTMFNEVLHQVVGFSSEVPCHTDGEIVDQLLSSPSLIYTIKDETITSVSKILAD